jgi:hypothetical protein
VVERLCSVLRQYYVGLHSKKNHVPCFYTIHPECLHDNGCIRAMAPLLTSASARAVVDMGEYAMSMVELVAMAVPSASKRKVTDGGEYVTCVLEHGGDGLPR